MLPGLPTLVSIPSSYWFRCRMLVQQWHERRQGTRSSSSPCITLCWNMFAGCLIDHSAKGCEVVIRHALTSIRQHAVSLSIH
jgi:hypothetical protein